MKYFLAAVFLAALTVTAAALNCPAKHVCGCSVVGKGAESLEIDCENKQLKDVPDLASFKGLPVHFLSLANNRISRLPDLVLANMLWHAMPNQNPYIDVSNNPLTKIGDNAFDEMRGEALGLRMKNCSLESVPVIPLRKMANWTFFFFGDNKIKNIPDGTFSDFKKLRHVELSGNPIPEISDNLFHGITDTLENVNLNNMGLSKFPLEAIRRAKRLETLTLDHNKIAALHEKDLGKLLTTRGLSIFIRNNSLTSPPANVFEGAKFSLKSFRLENNAITNLDMLQDTCSRVFNAKPNINVGENPLECDCKMHKILSSSRFDVTGRCTNEEYQGVKVIPVFIRKGNKKCIPKDEKTPYIVTCGATKTYLSLGVVVFSVFVKAVFSS